MSFGRRFLVLLQIVVASGMPSFLGCAGSKGPKLGVPKKGPHSKDYSILGSILRSPQRTGFPHRPL